ncbi:MAG: nuclear transport factor 2 family protein [Sneathiella sp.]
MNTTTLQSRAELSDLTDRFVDAFNRRSMDDVMSFFAEQAVYKDAYGKSHEGKAAISKAFEPVLDGSIGKILFDGDDRFIDAETGKVMDSWTLHMFRGEGADKEKTMMGLDLLHFENGKLVRKITYKRG